MFSGSMRESNRGVDVPMPGVSHAVFLKFLEFVYTDDVTSLSDDMALDLLVFAESYVAVEW